MTMTLTPAYGRDYKTKKLAEEAFASGVDWQIASFGPDMGRYVSAPEIKGQTVTLRFANLRKVTSVTA
jgi:hypothetical protein